MIIMSTTGSVLILLFVQLTRYECLQKFDDPNRSFVRQFQAPIMFQYFLCLVSAKERHLFRTHFLNCSQYKILRWVVLIKVVA